MTEPVGALLAEPETTAAEAEHGPRHFFGSVRAKMVAGLLALMTVGFLLAGAVLYSLQVAATNDRIDSSLRHAVGIFRGLADDPTERPSGERLLYLAMQRTLPAQDEGMVAFVDGRLRWSAPEQVPLRVEQDPELMEWIAASPGEQAHLTSVKTSLTDYRLVVLPVTASGGGDGRLVYAFDYAAERSRVDASFLTYLWVGCGALLLVGVAGWFVVGRLLRPVRALTQTAQRISQDHLSERIPVKGNDELAELTATVNGMLDRVEDAVLSQQRLLDDAGHELRTPITVVQGHLELMDPADPEDAKAVRDLAMDELGRMSFLVTDLVTLAQSGTEAFVRPRPVDVADLLTEVLAKASALGERRWQLGRVPAGVAELDDRRVTQALLQLASNAVKFSEPGTVVEFGGSWQESTDELLLWVRDEGVGIEGAEQEQVFERFARGAGARRTDGAGLGLSIVSAIAQAHGGRMELTSAPGLGSTFILRLPAPGATAPNESEDFS